MKQLLIDKIHALWSTGAYSKSDIAREVHKSRSTVYKALKMNPSEEVEKTIVETKVEQEQQEKKDIVDIIKGGDMSDMLTATIKILNNEETLAKEVAAKGINPIVNLFDKIIDKRLRVVEMEQRLKMDEQHSAESLEIISALSEKMDDFSNKAEINMVDVVDPNSIRKVD